MSHSFLINVSQMIIVRFANYYLKRNIYFIRPLARMRGNCAFINGVDKDVTAPWPDGIP